MTDEYFTILKNSKFEYKEKGSKFYGLGFLIQDIEEINALLKENSKNFYDATHHCYAYRLGYERNIFRYSDAGEPTGTAGKPILRAMDNSNITNTLIIVNRYYGGTKLGVSGLAKAYFLTADGAIKSAGVIKKIVYGKIKVFFEHELTNIVMQSIKVFEVRINEQNYSDCAEFTLEVQYSKIEDFKNYLTSKSNGKIKYA